MRILITGKNGQVAQSLAERAVKRKGVELVFAGRPEFDLTKPQSVRSCIARAKPNIIVSAAAYTLVDKAEDEPELAHAINAVGAGEVAASANELGAPIIHLSTDYVFSGDKVGEYFEDDIPAPANIYGASKLAGEVAVKAANPQHVILRVGWVYSPFGRNFVKTVLALARERDEISIVADQWGNPTSALDIADGILHIANELCTHRRPRLFGIFQLTGTGTTNWSGLASHILMSSRDAGGPNARVVEISTDAYPTKAKRPMNSQLSTAKLWDRYDWRAPEWRISTSFVVMRCVRSMTC